MTEKEAIRYFEYLEIWNEDDRWLSREDMKDFAECCTKALEDIQQYRAIGTVEECREAVDKQTPKKPEYEGDGYDDSGNSIYDTWKD